jgi:hypothetical protein
MIKKLTGVFTFLLFVCTVKAQQEPQWGILLSEAEFKAKRVIPPTPEAAALGKYGNVPVSLFTGTPSISVPLYEIAGSGIKLPVELKYNAGGFNPQEVATWVGLNWSLNAGGVVTRSVMGNPDGAGNFYKSPSPLVTPSNTTDPYGFATYMENIRKSYNDAQPDVYYYNFAGHSGKFLIKPDYSIFKKEKNNYIITPALGTITNSSFTITDDQGMRYEFMESEVSSMTPDDGEGIPITTYTYPSSWFLTKIVSADGFEEIGFTYYTTALEHTQFNNLPQNESDTYEQTQFRTGVSGIILSSTNGSVSPTVKTKRKYLQQVTYKKSGQLLCYIDFVSTVDQRQDLDHSTTSGFPGERLLTSVKVYTKNTPAAFALTKQYNLGYSYFTNTTSTAWNFKRLRLDNVQEAPVIAGTATPPAYVFTYSNDNLMPSFTGCGIDHWGYYNSGTGYQRLVPTTTITSTLNVTAANRQPSANGMLYLMNKITYPTGGYSTFEYELNAGKENSFAPAFTVGGARIKKITDYSFNSTKAVEKNYHYTFSDGSTSGRALLPGYVSSSIYNLLGDVPSTGPIVFFGTNPCIANLISTKTTTVVSASSNFGLGVIQGSHIGYSKVTEVATDVSNGQPLGKTVYDYYVPDNLDIHDNDIGTGDLLIKSVYDNGGKLLEETANTYNYSTLAAISSIVPGVSSTQDNKSTLVKFDAGGGNFVYSWYMAASCATNYVDTRIIQSKYQNRGWVNILKDKQLTQQVVKKYDQLSSSYISITKKFTYGNAAHTLPTSIEESTNNGELVITDKQYPLDYVIPGTGTLDQNTQGIKLLRDKNITGPEIETVQRRQNADGTNKRYISGMLTAYSAAIPYPASVYRLETSAPLTSLPLSSISAGNLVYNSNYKPAGFFVFLSNGALLQQSKNADMPTAYIWDYNYRYPTAEIANAQNGQAAYSSFETDETGGWTAVPNLTANRVTTAAVTGKYSYNLSPAGSITKTGLSTARQYVVSYWSKNGPFAPLTLTSTPAGTVTDKTGANHNGWYYYEHLLPVNTTAVTVAAAATVNIDELRLFPKDAFMSTVAYEPGVGAISKSSPQNLLSYYEYDGLNRLVNIKDENGHIAQNFKYNYGLGTAVTPSAQTLFYSYQKQAPYTKTGCPAGTEPTTETYVVPYGRYAATDQPSANAKADADAAANGQAYAQLTGKCLYWNTAHSRVFSKNDCPASEGTSQCTTSGPVARRGEIAFLVAAHTYSSETSLADANQKALDYINANGQTYANNTCWCSCTAIGYKVVNGSCELGTRYNSSTVQQGNGTWICYFYYEFSDGSVIEYSEVNATPCQIY